MMNEPHINEPPTCKTREKYLIGPISWKLLNQINYLLATDKEKEDFIDVMLHPKGYLCVRRAAQETIFGFEFRIPIDNIQLPIKLIEPSNEHDTSNIVIAAKESRYGAVFMNMGFTPGMGTTTLLQALMGDFIANEMMFTGKRFKGSELANKGTNINYIAAHLIGIIATTMWNYIVVKDYTWRIE